MEAIETIEARVQSYRGKIALLEKHLQSLQWLASFFPKFYEFRKDQVNADATVSTADPKCWMCNGHGIVDAGFQYAFIPERCPSCWCTFGPEKWVSPVALDTLSDMILVVDTRSATKPWLYYFANKDGRFNILDPVYRCKNFDTEPDGSCVWTAVKHRDDVTYLHRSTAVKIDEETMFKSSTLFTPTKDMNPNLRSYLVEQYNKDAEGMSHVLFRHWRNMHFVDLPSGF